MTLPFQYVYSDPHFGHRKVAEVRGFSIVMGHDRALFDNYFNTVGDRDVVLWLGDAFFCNAQEAGSILHRLPGRKWLLRGNHDWKKSTNWYTSIGFELVADGWLDFRLGDVPIRCCHFPFAGTEHGLKGTDDRYLDRRPVPRKGTGEVLLHGHTHSPQRVGERRQIHVGCDAWDLAPVPVSLLPEYVDRL
jgi:calcineurin-like phosphoesterase family protein